MTKELRILTGFHAGARIQLNATTMSIGAEATADILIQDWSEGTMELATDTQDRITLAAAGAAVAGEAAEAADAAVTLEDFAPRRFGDVVLCAGPCEAQWPSDLQLLELMLVAPADEVATAAADAANTGDEAVPVRPARHASWTRTGLMAMLIGAVGVGALALAVGNATEAAAHPLPRAGMADLRDALARLNEPDINLREQSGAFVASGIVANGEAARQVHTRLRNLAGNRLHWQVKPAEDVARELAESLHEPHVRVRYAGAGRFEVTGTAREPGAVRDVVERFRNDMAPLALKFGVKVERTDDLGITGKVESALSADSVRYIESNDGTKNFLADATSITTLH